MSKKTVKNISGQELIIPNIGIVKADEIITVDENFNNANFEVVKIKEELKNNKDKK